MSFIPEEYQINTLINQDTYLVNGELKQWTGQTTPVFSTISSTEKYTPTLLGSIPFMAEKEAAKRADTSLTVMIWLGLNISTKANRGYSSVHSGECIWPVSCHD